MTDRMRVSDESDPVLMHHWLDRWEAGIDAYTPEQVAATLRDLVNRLDAVTGGAGCQPSPPDVITGG